MRFLVTALPDVPCKPMFSLQFPLPKDGWMQSTPLDCHRLSVYNDTWDVSEMTCWWKTIFKKKIFSFGIHQTFVSESLFNLPAYHNIGANWLLILWSCCGDGISSTTSCRSAPNKDLYVEMYFFFQITLRGSLFTTPRTESIPVD